MVHSARTLPLLLVLGVAPPAQAVENLPPEHALCLVGIGSAVVEVAAAAHDRLLSCIDSERPSECLVGDPDGRLARARRAAADAEQKYCQALLPRRPAFGYTSAAQAVHTAEAAGLQLVGELLGSDPEGALRTRLPAAPYLCQRMGLTLASEVYREAWIQARTGLLHALAGGGRRGAPASGGPVGDAEELTDEILAWLVEDFRGAARAPPVARMAERYCSDASSIRQALPGVCAGASDGAGLARCAQERGRRLFYTSLARVHGLPVACDLTDDGRFDLSCAEASLVEHVLSRAGYGPDPWSRGRVAALGLEGYLREQLAPGSIPDPVQAQLVSLYPSLELSLQELRDVYPRDPPSSGGPGRARVPIELREAKLLRSVATRRQLAELLADVFFNHFNVNGAFGRRQWDVTHYDRRVIREGLLGRFGDLVLGVARSPAMLDYLDNGASRIGALNENFARELMELHTLGVEGGYDEADVLAVARVFTGWTFDDQAPDGFGFRPGWHDAGAKQVLGLDFAPGGGEEEGIRLIEHLAAQPATAERVARLLARRLVTEQPRPALVARGAEAYLASDGNLARVTEALLFSPDFLLFPGSRRSKVKRPHVLVASAARALAVDPAALDLNALRDLVRRLGEDLFAAHPPTGYPDASAFWSAPGSLVIRLNQLDSMARGQKGFSFELGISDGDAHQVSDALVRQLLPAGVSEATRNELIVLLEQLGGEPFERRAEAGLSLLLSSPEFLQH